MFLLRAAVCRQRFGSTSIVTSAARIFVPVASISITVVGRCVFRLYPDSACGLLPDFITTVIFAVPLLLVLILLFSDYTFFDVCQ